MNIEWDALSSPSDGGSSITSYHLVWDNASGADPSIELEGLSTPYTLTSIDKTTGITAG